MVVVVELFFFLEAWSREAKSELKAEISIEGMKQHAEELQLNHCLNDLSKPIKAKEQERYDALREEFGL